MGPQYWYESTGCNLVYTLTPSLNQSMTTTFVGAAAIHGHHDTWAQWHVGTMRHGHHGMWALQTDPCITIKYTNSFWKALFCACGKTANMSNITTNTINISMIFTGIFKWRSEWGRDALTSNMHYKIHPNNKVQRWSTKVNELLHNFFLHSTDCVL